MSKGISAKSIVLKPANSKAYAYYKEGEVESDSGSAFDPMSILEVEPASNGGTNIHLRFRHTNRYWSVSTADHKTIVAVSKQPVDSTADPNCTLFTSDVRDESHVRFTHVRSGKVVGRSSSNSRLHVGGPDVDFIFKDSDSVIQIPKVAVFKGDNEKYLQAYVYNYLLPTFSPYPYFFPPPQSNMLSYSYLQYSADQDYDFDKAVQEVSWHADGYIRIKSKHYGKFWRCGTNWIEVISNDEQGDDRATWFWPVMVDPNTVALRAEANGRFVKRLTQDGKVSCLNASLENITKEAWMVVEEPILERSIYNLRFLMEYTRVFDEKPFQVAEEVGENPSDTERSMTFNLSKEVSTTQCFNNSVSITVGVKATLQFEMSKVLNIGGEISFSVSGSHQWGEQKVDKQTVGGSYVAKVPPRSKVKVSCVATQGKCSVPFSYTQRDKRSNDGRFVTTDHVDGIFNGLTYYAITFKEFPPQQL